MQEAIFTEFINEKAFLRKIYRRSPDTYVTNKLLALLHYRGIKCFNQISGILYHGDILTGSKRTPKARE